MPVVAVAVAIGASVMAGTAVAAAGLTVVTALEITAAVGATLGAIGAVTRNKGLATAGMVIGAVGAIGGFAAGAGLLGEAAASGAPLFGSAEQAASGAAQFSSGAASGADSALEASGAFDSAAVTADAAGSGVAQFSPGAASGADSASAGTVPFMSGEAPAANETMTLASTSEKVADPAALVSDAAQAPGTSANPLAAETSGKGVGQATWGDGPVTTAGKTLEAPGDSWWNSGTIGKIVDYAGDHPVVALGALQAGGSLLSSAFSGLTPAQIAAYNAQAAANDAAAAQQRQQTANLAMPKAVAYSSPVTGTPAELVPGATQRAAAASQGFINQAKPIQVTGVPAAA